MNGRESLVGGVEGTGEEIPFDKGLDSVKGAGNERNVCE